MTTEIFPATPKTNEPVSEAEFGIILQRLEIIRTRIESYNSDLCGLGDRAYAPVSKDESASKTQEPPVAPGLIALNAAKLDEIITELDIMSSAVGRITNLA